jgi:superoxide dismutase, Cu-Zn family
MTDDNARRHPADSSGIFAPSSNPNPRTAPRILTSNFASPRPAVHALVSGVVAVSLLAACGSTSDPGAPKAAKAEITVAEARFQPIGGSSLTGAAMLGAYDGGVQMRVNFNGRGPGRYRVMIHANGNCSSPNGFSAGPPWAPPGVSLAEQGFPIFKNDDSASYVVRLAGYHLTGPDGVVGRSVVVHEGGTGTIVAKPDVPNDRIGCGVIGPPGRTLLDLF